MGAYHSALVGVGGRRVAGEEWRAGMVSRGGISEEKKRRRRENRGLSDCQERVRVPHR